MNTKKKSSWLSLLLALAMMITTSLTGLIPVSGAANTVQAAGNTRTIYFTTDGLLNDTKWNADNGYQTVAIEYGTNGVDNNTWMAMAKIGSYRSGYLYKADVPSTATYFRVYVSNAGTASKPIYYVPGIGNAENNKSGDTLASTLFKIENDKYVTLVPGSTTQQWDGEGDSKSGTVSALETDTEVAVLYGRWYYNNGTEAAANGVWAKRVSKSDLGLSSSPETRDIYFTTMNSEKGWNYSDSMYIYQNGTWTPMGKVKEDTLNVNNSNKQRGTIWKGTISAYDGAEFRFASNPSDNTKAYGVNTNEKIWAINDSVSAKIIVKNGGYWVQRPDGSSVWASTDATLSFTNTDAQHVFYNYGKYGISGTEYNHGVAMYSVGSADFKSYGLSDVIGKIAGTTFYINDIGSLLTPPITVTYKFEKNGVTKDGGTLTKDSESGLYSITIPELTNEDNTADDEWKYVTVTDAYGTVVLSDYDVTQVNSSKPVYTYGITVTSSSVGETSIDKWLALDTTETKSIDKTKLYVGNTGITSLRINGNNIQLTNDDDGDYFAIPSGVSTKTVITAGASDETGTATTYNFCWTDPEKDTLAVIDDVAVVSGTHVSATGINSLAGITNPAGGKFRLTNDILNNNQTYTITGDVELDLNGHQITTSSQLFTVTDGASLTIIDSKKVSRKKSTLSDWEKIDNFDENSALKRVDSWEHLSSVQRNASDITVTYYVTEAVPYDNATENEKATLKGTKDTWYKYEDTVYGRILTTGTPNQIIEVSGKGTFNLESGAITVGDGKNVQHLVLNRGTFNMTGGYLVGNSSTDKTGGGAVYNYSDNGSAGTMTMTGGVIAANSAANAGAIYNDRGGTLVISGGDEKTYGGVISGNKCNYNSFGGGIYSVNSAVTISGNSYITNNYQPGNCNESDTNNDETQSGGGGIATRNGTFTMDGGNVTGNLAGNSGGGLYIGYYEAGTSYTFSGGYVSENMCYHGEGGGIRISGGSDGKIKGNIYITNNGNLTGAAASGNQPEANKLSGTWGGGGIFVQTNGKLTIETALITNNYAGGYGGGFAACPTGAAVSVSNTGAAIYGNDALDRNMTTISNGKNKDEELHNGKYSDDVEKYFAANSHNARDYFSAGAASISGAMLGYTTAKWSGYIDSKAVGEDQYSMYDTATGNDFIGLTANPSKADKQESTKLSTVVISGNYSYTHGGGCMTNGSVVLGSVPSQTESYPTVRLTGLKNIIKDAADNSDYSNDFTFKLVTAEPQIISQKIALVNQAEVAAASVLDGNKFYLDWNLTESECKSSNGFTYYMYEQAGESGNVTYDDTIYQITGTIGSEQESIGSGENNHAKLIMTHYFINTVSIKKGTVSNDHTQIQWTDLKAGDSGDYTAIKQANRSETITFNKTTFTNLVELPKTEVSVHKVWLSNEKYTQEEADAGKIPSGYKVGDYKPLTGAAANTDANFILYRYSTNAEDKEFYHVANDGVTVTWTNNVTEASTLPETGTDTNIYTAGNLDVYYQYNKNSETNEQKYTYVVAEKCDNNTYVAFPGSGNSSVKLSDGSSYFVNFTKDSEITDTNTGVIAKTNYTVTNRPETYTLPLTGSSGWNKGSLYLLMLLIAVSAVGIYTVNKLKRETQVYAKKQEEN